MARGIRPPHPDGFEYVLMGEDRLLMGLAGAVRQAEARQQSGADGAGELAIDPVAAGVDDRGVEFEVGPAPLLVVAGVRLDHILEGFGDLVELPRIGVGGRLCRRGRLQQLPGVDQR